MPFDNFTNMKAAIISRSKRSDVTDADATDYVTQTEAEFYNNAQSPLRCRAMEARSTAAVSTSSRFLALPTNFLQMRALHIVTSGGVNQDVKYYTPEQMSVTSTSGRPRFFTVTTQLEFDRTPDSAYTIEMQYVRKLSSIVDENTNTILTEAPNIYLFGGLWALFQDKQDFELAEYYYGKFISALAGYNKTDKKGRYGPAPRIRIEGETP